MFGKGRAADANSTNHARGVEAESLAQEYLEGKGFSVIKTRYKTKFGEIDLIVKQDDVLCFVEVKARSNKASALESVTFRSQKRIERSALFFLSEFPEYIDFGMQFDVITITPPFHVTHLENAWEARSSY
ncbi:MAG: YraN family protein [Alphaproteobacteria bacterium]